MTSPPGPTPILHGITGTRPKAETKRQMAGRVINAMKAAGLPPRGWQVRSLVASLVANDEEPSDEDITRRLMAAPWFPKPRVRRHDIGGPGWRTHT